MRSHTHLTDADLLALIEHQRPSPRVAEWRAHLEGCEGCQARYETVLATLSATLQALREPSTTSPDLHDASRAALRLRLAAAGVLAGGTTNASRRRAPHVMRWTVVAAMLVVAVGAVVAPRRSLTRGAGARVEDDALPMRRVTPGATATVSLAQLCGGRPPGPEPADPSVRQEVLSAYGMVHVPEHEYELDYLITPALGGANDPRNLWPERYSNRRWNAKVKDQLEDLLSGLVCEGKVDLETAQRDIADDWVEAYKKYFKTQVPLGSS